MYDIIICDVFIDIVIPDFILSNQFLDKINNLIVKGGQFHINTIGINNDELVRILQMSFKNSTIETKNQNSSNMGNIIGFITKK